MGHSVVEVYLHIVFSTKNREPYISDKIEKRLFAYLGGIARKKKVGILRINGTEDHVHLLLKLHASVAIAKLVGDLKAYSTAFIKKQGSHEFAWQEGYGAFSCSKNHLEAIKKYIDKQKEHHQVYSFGDEMNRYARRWGFRWASEG